MDITRRTLFESKTLLIGLFEARNVSNKIGDVERQDANVVVLPFSGVFSKHDAPGREVIGTPSHAVFIMTDTPYRLGYPGAIGDRALILRFGDALAPDVVRDCNGETPASNGLLPAKAIMQRNLLGRSLASGADAFEIEARGLDLLDMALAAMRPDGAAARRSVALQRLRALARVKEAVAVTPAAKWTIEKLARIAGLSPFHLCRVFRAMTGTSIYDYVLRERLACALDAVLDSEGDLTAVALDAGFSSHSHFTARFRGFFGCTPAALRRRARTEIAQLRKIVTARRSATA